MRVHAMLAALALVCLELQASAYPIQVQTVPLALQGVGEFGRCKATPCGL